MKELEIFDFDKMAGELKDKRYDLIYMNYDVANGVKACKSLDELSQKEKEDFYRVIMFNDEFMITVYKFGEGEYRYNEITKADFSEYEEKAVFVDEKYGNIGKKILVRQGKVKTGTSFQFIGFEGGAR